MVEMSALLGDSIASKPRPLYARTWIGHLHVSFNYVSPIIPALIFSCSATGDADAEVP